MVKSRFRLILTGLITVFSGLAVISSPVSAKSEIQILLSPATQKLDDLKPGETSRGKFKVFNTGTKKFRYKLSSAPFQVINKKYEHSYTIENQYTQIHKWISFPEPSGVVLPDQNVEVPYVVNVPNDVPAGGQYAVIFVSTDDDGSEGGQKTITTTKSVGMKIYGRVPGNTREEGEILGNSIDTFLFKPPVFATSTVKSTSNVDIAARYDFEVINFFTGRLAYRNDEDSKEQILLPNTEYTGQINWKDAPQLGVFRVRQTVKLLDKVSTVEKIVFVLPLWFIFLVLLTLFLAVFWVISRIKARRARSQASKY